MSKSDKFGGVGNYGVIIPYADLEKLLKTAQVLPDMQSKLDQMERRNAAIAAQYVELLEKVAEINRML